MINPAAIITNLRKGNRLVTRTRMDWVRCGMDWVRCGMDWVRWEWTG